MNPVTIDVDSDSPFTTQTTNLDGVAYTLDFQYQQRFDRFLLIIGDGEGNPIMPAFPLVPRVDLLQEYRYLEACPPGALFVTVAGNDLTPPGFGELGTGRRCELVYIPVKVQ